MSSPGSHSIYHNGTFSASQMRKSKLACDLPWREKVREANYRTRYLFNGKELDTETNLYYYGARYFEPNIAVWYGVDPLTEKYPFTSSYVYCDGNPVKYVDPDGKGPEERVAAARSQLGIPYKQEEGTLRTDDTDDALAYMDCSEFVCRVMAADGLTDGVQGMNSAGIRDFLEKGDFEKSTTTPQVGDIAVWEGHVGIVTEVDGEKFKLAHARGKDKLSAENGVCTDKSTYRTSEFYGFYREADNTVYFGEVLPEIEVVGERSYVPAPIRINVEQLKTQTTNEQP